MELYLLSAINDVTWDETEMILVRASSEGEARRLVTVRTLTDDVGSNREDFLDPSKTYCKVLTSNGEPGIILAQTKWG